MRYSIHLLAIAILASCTTAKLPVSDAFSSQATKMPVKGINGWQVNQKLSFGNYTTSKIKRGWDFTSSVQYTKFKISPEEAILKVFDINTDKNTNTQKNKFQYIIENGTFWNQDRYMFHCSKIEKFKFVINPSYCRIYTL